MARSRFILLVLICVASAARIFAQENQPAADETANAFKQTIRPFLAANCTACHGAKLQLGELNLERLASAESLVEHRDTWQLVLDQLETGEMPPRTMPKSAISIGEVPKPSGADRQAIMRAIKAEFARAESKIKPSAGRVSARRLNRAEYNNTIQDLLGVKMWPASDFPQDDAAYGFDNVADALAISPVLMEKYMSAAEKVARAAVFGPEKMLPAVKKLEQLERDVTNITVVPKEYDETGLTTDRALHAMYRFPVDGVYLFRVTARGFRPLGCDPLELGLWLDGKLVAELKVDPKEDGPSLLGGRQDLFGKPQDHKMFVTAGDHWVAASVLRIYEGLPPAYNGPNPSKRVVANPPAEVALQPAEKEKLAADEEQKADPDEKPVEPVRDANAQREATPEVKRADAAVKGAEPGKGARQGRGDRAGRRDGGNRLAPIETQVGIDYVDLIGPLDQTQKPTPDSLKKLFPRENMDRNDPNTPREILANFTRRAFRRPVAAAEVDRYVTLFEIVRKQGDSFDEALAVAIQAVLVAPDFLLRIEREPAGGNSAEAHPITDHELATRLSYFLWSTMPDDELRAAADRGTLRQAEMLEQQVRRMLKDPRAHSLAENFAGQWLRVRALESVTPDFKLFPEFDENLRLSMQRETEMFFDHVVHEDRSALDFVSGKYTFVNEKLAKLYGLSGVKGPEFRMVDLTGTPRAGVLTQASVLTVSSYATRTSPVLRGKFILENVLNAPPPPPPNNVPALEDTIKNNPEATLRQQLEMHRANPSCAGCHAKMDPLGMSLENFNAVGAWRTQDGKLPIDASGKLPDGRSFNGPVELRQVLESNRDVFVKCLTEKLLTYALGRGIEKYDRAAIQEILGGASANDYRFSSLVMGIVKSLPFQNRTSGNQP
jgi:Protein of unknown function (DUF1592)/Protein of unknown function (DUF1588)/Protein of unknown function (DUF1587)/Protein of unknown function (DUF1585)/Protein of unknown function (DUF1595)/Planctomycete cytochrome C